MDFRVLKRKKSPTTSERWKWPSLKEKEGCYGNSKAE
jgi:hypothetical protein